MANANHEVKFADLCHRNPKEGYALDSEPQVIDASTSRSKDISDVCKKIKDYIKQLEEGTDRRIDKYWIRKTYARKRTGIDFDLEDSSTWKHTNINQRYSTYRSQDDIDGMVVVAAVNKKADPHAEEYTLTLKKAVVEKLRLRYNGKIKGTTGPGIKDGGKSPGYILYLTYKLTDTQKQL